VSSDQIIQRRREEISQAIADGTIAAKHSLSKDGKLVKAARQNTLTNFFSKRGAEDVAQKSPAAKENVNSPPKKGLFKYLGKEPRESVDSNATNADSAVEGTDKTGSEGDSTHDEAQAVRRCHLQKGILQSAFSLHLAFLYSLTYFWSTHNFEKGGRRRIRARDDS
jgi:hypothetical protein